MSIRVEVHPLPCYEGAHQDAGAKRLMMSQGEFALLHPACPEIRFLSFLGFKKGIARGGHYHIAKKEFFYLLHGHIELRARDRKTGDSGVFQLKEGDLAVISPEVEHLYMPSENCGAIEFSADVWSPTDTIKA
jgi:mannose-6-phosphate isomerase-like protein (cupin superfamily)